MMKREKGTRHVDKSGIYLGTCIFYCDKCGESEDNILATDDFKEALADMKIKGWVARFIDGKWQHFCSSCK